LVVIIVVVRWLWGSVILASEQAHGHPGQDHKKPVNGSFIFHINKQTVFFLNFLVGV
jgi:hypothetical protein